MKDMMMSQYKYLIVGGGMTADAAVKGIRELDPSGSVGLISAKQEPPYNRPPLTKGLWKDKSVDTIWRHTEDREVECHLGHLVSKIDLVRKQVQTDGGDVCAFSKLLLATGGRPRRLPFDDGNIIYFRTVEDYRRLRAVADRGGRFAVIGGGFIGSEIAAALAMNGCEVTIVFPEKGIGGRVFPDDLAVFLNGYYGDKGVEVRAEQSIEAIETREGCSVLSTSQGTRLVADTVVAGIGTEPNIELAKQAGLTVNDGILVDEFLRTSHSDIYAAGDVASFYNPALGKRIRVEHEDNANTMGHHAGRNMAGAREKYHHLPYFYSDLFDLGYEAVGEVDAELENVADWETPFQKGVIYYLRQGSVCGVLLWNVWDQIERARSLIASARSFSPKELERG